MADKKAVAPKKVEMAFAKLEVAFGKLQDAAPRNFKSWKKRDAKAAMRQASKVIELCDKLSAQLNAAYSALNESLTGGPTDEE